MAKAEKKNDSLATIQKELAAQAAEASGMEAGTASGTFFSTSAGQLKFEGAPVPGNQMAVVIVGSIMENIYYVGKYNPEEAAGPTCYAFGRDEKAMKPYKAVENPVAEQCDGCPNNEWGTADTGKGKACRNSRRLALLPAGKFGRDGNFEAELNPEHYENVQAAFLKLPVTSVKGYASKIRQLEQTLHLPPHAVFMKVSVVPNAKTQFSILFDVLGTVPAELLPALMSRYKGMRDSMEFPYSSPTSVNKTDKAAKKKKY